LQIFDQGSGRGIAHSVLLGQCWVRNAVTAL
jgi:hypothetical protein